MTSNQEIEYLNTSKLGQLFSMYRDRSWYFVKPGGNWGDHLIYAGAESLARRTGLRWETLDHSNFDPSNIPPGAAIYLHGGGGFNPWGSKRAFKNFQRAVSVENALVIQGPQTVETESIETAELFKETLSEVLAQDVHFLAREEQSFNYLRTLLSPTVHIQLDHDTAFHLSKLDVINLAELSQCPRGRYDLLIVREDDEAPDATQLANSSFVVMDPAYYAVSFKHWVRIHAFSRRVISNRLHSAIVGALLEKPVILMPGRYHKNRSIWEQSLMERGVEWGDEGLASKSQNISRGCAEKHNLLAKRIQSTRAFMWLRGVPIR